MRLLVTLPELRSPDEGGKNRDPSDRATSFLDLHKDY
jgi:hypothetical protein